MCEHECRYLKRPKDGVESSRAGVVAGCEQFNVGAGTESGSSGGVSALNCWYISSPQIFKDYIYFMSAFATVHVRIKEQVMIFSFIPTMMPHTLACVPYLNCTLWKLLDIRAITYYSFWHHI